MTHNEISNHQANLTDETMGEFMIWTNSGLKFPEGTPTEEKLAAMVQAGHYELVASAKAVQIGHAINPDFVIGGMLNVAPLYPASPKPADMLAVQKARQARDWFSDVHVRGEYPAEFEAFAKRTGMRPISLKKIGKLSYAGTVDYLAISYYNSFVIKATSDDDTEFDNSHGFEIVPNPEVQVSDWGWAIDPQGLRLHVERTERLVPRFANHDC